MNNCISQLKARVEGIKSRIEELRPQQEANNEIVGRLCADIKKQGSLGPILQTKMDLYQQQVSFNW